MVFVIAEIGVNWDGDRELVEQLMSKSKKIGCNAVKFQAFSEDLVNAHPEKDRLMKSTITASNIEIIDKLANSIGIEWFCTPMYPEAVDLLNPFVDRFKIRELDGRLVLQDQNSEILQKILKTGKQVILSSQRSPKNSKLFDNTQIKWLYCVPKYPCDLKDLDFTDMKYFDGFSNHSKEIIVPLVAATLGAEIIEVHVTLDKSKNYIDNNVSFDFNELGEIVRNIRLIEKIKR